MLAAVAAPILPAGAVPGQPQPRVHSSHPASKPTAGLEPVGKSLPGAQPPITSAATTLRNIHALKMSPGSTSDSPHSAGGGMTAPSQPPQPTTVRYPLPSRDGFQIEIPSPQLTSAAN